MPPKRPVERKRSTRNAAARIRFFATPANWRQWLEKNHASETELWVGYYKKGSGKPSIDWPQSVDEALCFGWIDGIRKTIDESSYKIRFTPRRTGSNWSTVNIARVGVLTKEKRMRPAGLAAFEARTLDKSGPYSYEQRKTITFGDALERRFRANAKAWAFFEAQPPYYRQIATLYVMSAKQEATRERRLDRVIKDFAAGRRLEPGRSTRED